MNAYINTCPCQSPSFKFGPWAFYTRFYNHARRLRLETLLLIHLGLSRSPNNLFKHFWIQVAGRYETVSEAKRLQIYNGYV